MTLKTRIYTYLLSFYYLLFHFVALFGNIASHQTPTLIFNS